MDHQAIAQMLGSYGEFFGAIAVVATLFYLVLQVRQNTTSIRSQSRYQVLEALTSDMRDNLGQSPRELIDKIAAGDATLPDRTQFKWYWASLLSHIEMLYYEIEDKALPESFRESLRFRLAFMTRTPDYDLFWEVLRPLFTEPFRDFVESIVPIADDILLANAPSENNPFDWFSQGFRGS
jgi:hypothetical protein